MVGNNEKTIKGISADGKTSLMINSKYWGDYSTSDLATINKKSILSGVDIELVKPEELQEVKDYVSESSQVIAKALIDLDGRIKNFDNIPLEYLVNVTYSNLVEMRNNSVLTPGQQYRITDYVTTTSDKNTISAGHRFDIIVTANSENSLYDIARAYYNEDDSYFVDNLAKLEAWQIWYSLDNDTNRFDWADSNGTGVIYRMIDEWNNDCPYDFKNIMFKRKVDKDRTGVLGYKEECDGTYDDVFCYTFSWVDSDKEILDGTIVMNSSDDSPKGVYNNKIKPCNYNYNNTNITKTNKRFLNNNVFFNSLHSEIDDYVVNGEYVDGFVKYVNVHYGSIRFVDAYAGYLKEYSSDDDYLGCFSNIFGYNCVSNTFNNFCCLNSFGDECSNNSFGQLCVKNSFGNKCTDNFLGDLCSYNVFKESCNDNNLESKCFLNSFGSFNCLNTLGDYCFLNSFGDCCRSIEIGKNCFNNTFGYNCNLIDIGKDFSENTFEHNCYSNTFGKHCYSITLSNYCYSNTFGDHNYYIELGVGSSENTFGKHCYNIGFLLNNDTTRLDFIYNIHSGENVHNTRIYIDQTNDINYKLYSNVFLKNIYIPNGFGYNDNNYNYTEMVRFYDFEMNNNPYVTTIAKNSSGYTTKFCIADLVQKIQDIQEKLN